MASKPKRTPGELLDAIHEMALDDELEAISNMSDEEIAADIRAHGGDPEAIGKRGAEFALREIAEQKKLAEFLERAERDLVRALTVMSKAPKTPPLPRKELEARIDRFGERSRRLAEPIQLAFMKRTRGKASDEELRSFLDALEKLEALAAELDVEEPKSRHGSR